LYICSDEVSTCFLTPLATLLSVLPMSRGGYHHDEDDDDFGYCNILCPGPRILDARVSVLVAVLVGVSGALVVIVARSGRPDMHDVNPISPRATPGQPQTPTTSPPHQNAARRASGRAGKRSPRCQVPGGTLT